MELGLDIAETVDCSWHEHCSKYWMAWACISELERCTFWMGWTGWFYALASGSFVLALSKFLLHP